MTLLQKKKKQLPNPSATCTALDVARLKNSIHPLATPKVIILNKFNQISLKTVVSDCFSDQIKEKNLNSMPSTHGYSPSTKMLVIISSKPFLSLIPILCLTQLQIILASALLLKN